MSLIKQISNAIETGELQQPFTTEDLKEWINNYNIVKDDGTNYAESSINAILSNSDQANSPTTNLNKKVLFSRNNELGKKEYSFLPIN